jgi:hypothetical protein
MSSTQVAVTIIVILVVLVVIAGLWAWNRSRRLKQQFGPEYDRAVKDNDGRLAGERELRDRERRHAQLHLADLDPEARDRYAKSWEDVQILFVEDPVSAVRQGDALVTQLINDRGYPQGTYDEQVAQLSVDHAETLQHYRDAHDINLVNERGEATTEQLRQALVHYRALFADVLGEDSVGRTSATPVPDHAATDNTATEAAALDADRPDPADADRADLPGDRTDAGRAALEPDADRPDATRTIDPEAVNQAAAGRHTADAVEQEDSRA